MSCLRRIRDELDVADTAASGLPEPGRLGGYGEVAELAPGRVGGMVYERDGDEGWCNNKNEWTRMDEETRRDEWRVTGPETGGAI